MNSKTQTHPQLEQLSAFAVGKLEPAAIDEIATHLDDCDECQQSLRDMPDDTFVSLVRDAHTISDGRREPQSLTGEQTILHTDAACDEIPASPDDAVTIAPRGQATTGTQQRLNLSSELANHPRYDIVDLIGLGGMGAVYKAEHRMMKRTVALKVINPQLIANKSAVDRFHREVQAAARLHHPNIVTAHDAEQAGDVHFLVMEYVEGADLHQIVGERGPLPVAEACEYIRQAALGLQHAHENGMVHRDIKPQNLIVARGKKTGARGEGRGAREAVVKILDFGLASLTTEVIEGGESEDQDGDTENQKPGLTQAGSIMGTPDYMAPEQAKDAHAADIRADIYSLGCTLYTLLTGKAPFPGGSAIAKIKAHALRDPQSAAALRNDLPKGFIAVLKRMMAKEPVERFQTPAEVAEALKPFAGGFSVSAKSNTKAKKSRRRSRMGWLVGTVAVAIAVLLGGIIWVATDNGQLKIECKTDDVQVVVSKGGKEYEVIDVKSGSKVTRLPSGEYRIALKGNRTDVKLSKGGFTMSRGGMVIVTVTPEAATELDMAEYTRVVRAGRGELPDEDKQKLLAENHPLFGQLADPHTKKIIELFANLPDGAHKELWKKEYLKWKYTSLDKTRQKVYYDSFKLNLDMATKNGARLPPTMSLEALKKADVGFATVTIPQLKTKVVSWYIILPKYPLPIWVTVVGVKSAGQQPYFTAHQQQLPKLRLKPYSSDIQESEASERIKINAATKAADAWLKLKDAGKFAECWDESSKTNRDATGKQVMVRLYEKIAKQVGKVKSRKLVSNTYTTSPPGSPPGEYVVLQYKTEFEFLDAVETVTPMSAKDGWRVSGYYVRPRKAGEFDNVPSLPKAAADVPRFWVGDWSSVTRTVVPKLPAEKALNSGILRMSLVSDGKFLRGVHTMDGGRYQALNVQTYNKQKQTLLSWLFLSDGSGTGDPATGIWDADTRTLVFTKRLPNGTQAVHQFEFVDVDTVKSRAFRQNEKDEIVSDMRFTFTRLQAPVADKQIPIDLKRPAEMKVIDRMIGEWWNEVTIKHADQPGKPVIESTRTLARSIVAGRMVEAFDTNDAKQTSEYWLMWFDPERKQYRVLYFGIDGTVTDAIGVWENAKKTMTWTAPDKTVEGRWIFKSDDVREVPLTIRDKAGKTLIQWNGISRRVSLGWTPLPEKLCAEWEAAGFQTGWTSQSQTGYRYLVFASGKDEVPAFSRKDWKAGILDALPQPERPFGLYLWQSGIDDPGIRRLARFKHLHTLDIGNTRVTDAGLKHLAGLTQLQRLSLYALFSVSDAGLKELRGLKQLRVLNLGNAYGVTDRGLKELAQFTELHTLDLTNTKVSDAGLKELGALQQLECLTLNSTKVTDTGMKGLAKLKRLEALHLGFTNVSDAGLKEIGKLKQLQELTLIRTGVTDVGLKELRALKQLQTLALANTKVTDAGLKELTGLKQLRQLGLQGTSVTDDGVRRLQEALPALSIFRDKAGEFKNVRPEKGGPKLNSIAMKLQSIPPGEFLMGSPEFDKVAGADEKPKHSIRISKAFYLGVYEVTQKQFETVMGRNPSFFQAGVGGGPDHPVEQVTWNDAIAFCRKLSELPAEKKAGRTYRLPTEAEWEYACRAGTATPFSFGASLSSRQANFNGGYILYGAKKGPFLKRTMPVGSYPANAFGLHDMHGNVWEWCADYYDEGFYQKSPTVDPTGPKFGRFRVTRGGCWLNSDRDCRSAGRGVSKIGQPRKYEGFRVVCEIVEDEQGWTPLFNGKDLTGWKAHPNWRVEDGVLIGSGPVSGKFQNAMLYSERNDFADFHLRLEARLLGAEADSGVFIRGLGKGSYCEANIGFKQRFGSLSIRKLNSQAEDPWIYAPPGLVKLNEWVVLEIIARGQHVITKVNGMTAAETRNADVGPRGRITLQQKGEKTVIQFRKIEIKELPPSQSTVNEGQANIHQRLQGKWVPISGHIRAKPFTAKQLANMSFTFDGNRVETVGPDGNDGGAGTFKIDAKRKPMFIDLIAPDGKESLPGIFEFDGDRLKLAFIDEDYARPKDFAPSKQPDHMTLVCKRVPVKGGKFKTEEAVKAAEQFLAAMDNGRFGEMHGLLARFAQRKTPRGKLSQSMQTVRDTFGKATSRTLQRVQLMSDFPGLPKGRYAGVHYKSNFERKDGLWESLLLNVDPDGVWRVNTYTNMLVPLPFPEVKD